MNARSPISSLRALLLLPLLAAPAVAQCPWEPIADAPLPRIEAGSIVVDDTLYLLGGFWNSTLQTSDRVDVYDPQSDTWSLVTHLPAPLTHHGVALVGRTLWVAGGFVGDHPGPVTDAVWKYDVDARTWSAGPSLPAIRGAGALVANGTTLHYLGGVGTDKDVSEGDHWVLDTVGGGGWTPLAPLSDPRNHFSAALFGGTIYLFGGQYRHDTNPEDLDTVLAYELATDTWSQVADMPYELSHAEPSTFVDAVGPVLAGGRSNISGPGVVERIIRYDPTLNEWRDLPPLPGLLVAPAVKLIQGVLYLTGGGAEVVNPTIAGWQRAHTDFLQLPLRMNCGGSAFAGPLHAWCVEDYALNGRNVLNPGLGDVANTDNDELYRSERQGQTSDPQHLDYRILIGNGPVRVTMHFAETFWFAANRRKFGASLEGLPVFEGYDIVATVGHAAADSKSFDVLVSDEWLDLSFVSTLDRPTIAGLELEALPAGTLQNYCVAGANSAGDGATIHFAGSTSVARNDVTLHVQGGPVGEPGLFIQGPNQIQQPFGAGFRCVGGGVIRLSPAVVLAADGSASKTLDLPNPITPPAQILPGSTWNFQFWYRDGAQATFNLSDGLRVEFGA